MTFQITVRFELRSRCSLFFTDSTSAGTDPDMARSAFAAIADFVRPGSDLVRAELWQVGNPYLLAVVDLANDKRLSRAARRRLRS